MLIDQIREFYDGNIELKDPNTSGELLVPDILKNILTQADGILETMEHPKSGEKMTIGWIIYSYDMIVKQSAFYKEEYGLDGTVFSDDGAGNPYYILNDKIYQFDPIDNESELKASSLEEFYRK